MAKSIQSAGRRLSTITLDQIIAGASNVLIAVLAARVLGVAAFGLFGIVFIVYVTAQGASRALVCEPILVHPVEAQERPGDAIGTAAVLGLGFAVAIAVGGLLGGLWEPRLGSSLLVLAACMPLLVLQDLGRYLGFATQRPTFSLALDILWLLLMFVGVGVLYATDHKTLTWFIVVWAGSGAAAGLPVIAAHARHRLRLSLTWLRETWSFSWRYLVSYFASQGSALVVSIGFGAIAGAGSLGAIRGAQLLQRPVNTFAVAAMASGVADVSRLSPSRSALHRHVRRTTSLTVLVAVLNMAVVLVLPDSIGTQVLGDSWEPAQRLLLPASLQMVLLAAISGPRSALLGRRQVRTALRIDIVTVAILVVFPLVGVSLNGALGAYWGFALGQGIVAMIWWAMYLRHDPTTETSTAVEAVPAATADAPATIADGPPVRS